MLASEGYSVIPVRGDLSPSEPKRPTMKWRTFQRRIAQGRELETMFDGRAGGLAIVCGRVSELLVIDFDDHVRYQSFCRRLPQYAASYTVKTRRGYHVYFRTRAKVVSHQFDGGDIKGEKSYVVAAPSVIAGFKYRVVNSTAVKSVDADEVDTMLKFFHVGSGSNLVPVSFGETVGNVDIVEMYERMYRVVGRNNALYRCASVGRAQGMARAEVERALLERHALARPVGEQKYEGVAERYREGRRTIASALAGRSVFCRDSEGVPNSVREGLLRAQKSSAMARLLDVMRMAGWRGESYFCMREAIELGRKFGLGRKSVMAALTGEHSSFNGRHIIARRYVEYLDIGGLKVGKRGRPVALLFQAPSVKRLVSVLEVPWSPSDPLGKDDLASGHSYRRALHREYVKRLSPRAPMAALADRLGVNPRTVRRYNAHLGVHVCERVGQFLLKPESLKCLPRRNREERKNHTPGYWLAVGDKARFPAWRHIGAALLKRGTEAVRVCVRRASVLSLGKPDARAVVYEPISAEAFMRLRIRRGEVVERAGLVSRLRDMVSRTGAKIARARYEKLGLRFDTVAAHIAEDKIAETIVGYLVADDGLGGEIRRPARRGVAYRMLKQFGEGNVYLALRESYSELMASLALRAVRYGDEEAGVGLLARGLA